MGMVHTRVREGTASGGGRCGGSHYRRGHGRRGVRGGGDGRVESGTFNSRKYISLNLREILNF